MKKSLLSVFIAALSTTAIPARAATDLDMRFHPIPLISRLLCHRHHHRHHHHHHHHHHRHLHLRVR